MNSIDQKKFTMEQLAIRGVDVEAVKLALRNQVIETPSWGYGNSGTRFAVFKQLGAARDIHERLADAAQVHRLTGVCPSVAIHVPWDHVRNYRALAHEASSHGLRIGSVNPNLFQELGFKLGSFGNPRSAVRRLAIDRVLECIDVMEKTGSRVLSLWFADGTNYPGQDNFRRRKRAFEECLVEIHAKLPERSTMLIEYKPFEPSFYHTDIADWGMASHFCRKAGPKAKVLVDLGHHLPGANIEHIVAFLIDEGLLGGFHFNNRKYADDDLTTGSINPYEVFLIFNELVGADAENIEVMIDQSHNLKPKLEAMITTVCHLQESYAKALCVNRKLLAEAQSIGDIVLAERCLQDAFSMDVRPLLALVREEMNCPLDPLLAYRSSNYQQKIETERKAPKEGASGWA